MIPEQRIKGARTTLQQAVKLTTLRHSQRRHGRSLGEIIAPDRQQRASSKWEASAIAAAASPSQCLRSSLKRVVRVPARCLIE